LLLRASAAVLLIRSLESIWTTRSGVRNAKNREIGRRPRRNNKSGIRSAQTERHSKAAAREEKIRDEVEAKTG